MRARTHQEASHSPLTMPSASTSADALERSILGRAAGLVCAVRVREEGWVNLPTWARLVDRDRADMLGCARILPIPVWM